MNEPADASDERISTTASNPDGGEREARQDADHVGKATPPESQFSTALQGSVWKSEQEIQRLEKDVEELFGSH